ncbi:transporter substrate-binding domain-containing protein [Algoriphagus sp. NF]|uniref:transglycosylase SLT domain-containing protein n=1 Tax=Algoriphagus sp. NF TaxID=2992756 RepID=UPI00237C46B2|nr:transporter substrate-binding domain-containing protein [Algoriphagus sp. NF]MDE0560460.1 transporter substrate-binding domain-containing protein [Algoriphagus sp. NF]
MYKAFRIISTFLILSLFGVQCTFLEKYFLSPEDEPSYFLDLKGIKNRGTLRVAVDNNSTGYYIYRGRMMGYEYEMLRDLTEELELGLEIKVLTEIDEAFDQLNSGGVDLIAMNLEFDSLRFQKGNFSKPLGTINTVLVGSTNSPRIQSWEDLEGDTIYVRKGTIYKSQLCRIKDSLNVNFTIEESKLHEETLIEKVVSEEIRWTVADQNIARANATYFDGLNISWKISEAKEVGWLVRKNSPQLLQVVNTWIEENEKKLIPILYSKYFLNSKNSYYRSTSPFSSLAGNRISVFDDLIKEGARELGWDWRLLASLVYRESRFDTAATSYAGAQGLLQLMPVTLERFGVENPNDPIESLRGGVRYLRYLDKFWLERVPEVNERIKFILASYNIGHGHVEDAWRLALKYGANTQTWEEVAEYLALKSDPEYYLDPLVRSGFAKGHLAVNYVRDILSVFESYKALVEP